MEAKERITRAKIQLQKTKPFFAYLLLHLKFIEDENVGKQDIKDPKQIGTMGVDNYGNLYYAPKFVDTLTESQLEGVLCHEVLHKALEHLSRITARDPQIWNISCDMTVNDILVTNGIDINIKDFIFPVNHTASILDAKTRKVIATVKDIDKKTAEIIYDELYSQLNKKGYLQQGFDVHIFSKDGKEITEAEAKEWKRRVVEGYTYAKTIGKEPMGIERQIGELLNEKVNWKALLYKYITNSIPHDYTYNYPSKRSIASGFYMPSMKKEEIEVVVAIDTSGSIGQEELSEFTGEMVSISKSFANVKMTAIICDCKVHDVLEFHNGSVQDILDMKVKGGGGTSHKLVFEWIAENKPTTRLLICLTDGYSDIDKCEETVKTIWCLNKNSCKPEDIPFGEVIKME